MLIRASIAIALFSIFTGTASQAVHAAPTASGHAYLDTTVGDYIYFDSFEQRTLAPTTDVNTPGLNVAMQGTPLLGLSDKPTPNTSLMLPGGSGTLVLNEQSVTGDGISGLTVSNNAVHVTLSVVGLITGDAILAHADAGIACN